MSTHNYQPIQNTLNYLKGEPNKAFQSQHWYEESVLNFQAQMGLLEDGIAGPVTKKALQEQYYQKLRKNYPGEDGKVSLKTLQADLHNGKGLSLLTLRADVADALENVRDVLEKHGAKLTSSGGIRSLKASVGPNRSCKSLHYLGRAFDLYIYSAMMDLQTDPYVVQRRGPREYVVYARMSQPECCPVEVVESVEEAILYTPVEARTRGRMAEGYFLNLAELMQKHGFYGIRARPSFERGGSILAAEWWHFQYQTGLLEGTTRFGDELSLIYEKQTFKDTPPYQYRKSVYGAGWR